MSTSELKGSPKKLLHHKLRTYEPARSIETIHISDLTSESIFCPREYSLLDLTKKKRKGQYNPVCLTYTFGIGRMLEEKVRNDWLRDHAIGDWKCVNCGQTVLGKKGSEVTACESCETPVLPDYVEPRFTSKVSGISGGVDLLLDTGNKKGYLAVEIKTMDKDYFIKLAAPMAEHKLRTNFYLRLISESDHPLKDKINKKEAVVIYLMKAFGKKDESLGEHGLHGNMSPFKEFTIPRNDADTKDITHKAKVIHHYRAGKITGLPLPVCKTETCQRAKKCTVSEECFSGDYPGSIQVGNQSLK